MGDLHGVGRLVGAADAVESPGHRNKSLEEMDAHLQRKETGGTGNGAWQECLCGCVWRAGDSTVFESEIRNLKFEMERSDL